MKENFYRWGEKVIILLAIIGVIFWVNRFLPSKALSKNIYPLRCFGEWLNPHLAVGEPNVPLDGDEKEFNLENSAFYQTGFKTIVCDGFEKIEGKFISAKLGLSLAINEIKEEPVIAPAEEEKFEIEVPLQEPPSPEQEEPQRKESFSEEEEQPSPPEEPLTPEEQSPTEESEQSSEQSEPVSFPYHQLFKILPIFAQEESETTTPTPQVLISPDPIFNLRYLIEEISYHLQTFSSYPLSNATNNGYFYFNLPEVKSFTDLEKLKISFEGLLGGQPRLTIWLDSVWLEVEYEEKPKVSLKAFQKLDGQDFEIFADDQGKEIQLTNNNFDDKFPHTDDNNEIVWQSQIDGRWQIFYLNLNDFLMGKQEPLQITKTKDNNLSPKVFNETIVWQAWLDNNWEIMVAEKTEESWQIERLTENQEHDLSPYFSEAEIFWQRKTKEGVKDFKALRKDERWEIQELFNQQK